MIDVEEPDRYTHWMATIINQSCRQLTTD